MEKTTYCPHCGQLINLIPKPGAPGRVWGFCPGYRLGPVVEMDADAAPAQEPVEQAQEVTQ